MNNLSDYQENRIRELEAIQEGILDQRDALRAHISELEAREEAEAKKIWAQLQRIAELENALEEVAEIWNARYDVAHGRIAELESQLASERDALLTSASDVVGMDVRIKELEAAYAEMLIKILISMTC